MTVPAMTYEHACRYCDERFRSAERLAGWSACSTHEAECDLRTTARITVNPDDGLLEIELHRPEGQVKR